MERRLRDEARNTGEALPARVQNAPILRLGSALYLNAWYDLDLERDRSKYDPIKRSSCFEYASDYEFDDEQYHTLWFCIARMDREFLKWYKAKQPKPVKGTMGGQRTVQRGKPE